MTDQGKIDQTCFTNGTCNAGLLCNAQQKCGWIYEDTSNAGAEGGPCFTDQTCTSSYKCLGRVCGGSELDPTDINTTISGGAPRFAWGAYKALMVFVVPTADPMRIVWGLRSEKGLDSPLELGAPVSGADVLANESLVAGTSYHVVVLALQNSDAGARTTFEIFTP